MAWKRMATVCFLVMAFPLMSNDVEAGVGFTFIPGNVFSVLSKWSLFTSEVAWYAAPETATWWRRISEVCCRRRVSRVWFPGCSGIILQSAQWKAHPPHTLMIFFFFYEICNKENGVAPADGFSSPSRLLPLQRRQFPVFLTNKYQLNLRPTGPSTTFSCHVSSFSW